MSHVVVSKLFEDLSSNGDTRDLRTLFGEVIRDEGLNYNGHTIMHAIAQDCLACLQRDPACQSLLEAILYFKGFASLVCHRVSNQLLHHYNMRYSSLYIQSKVSSQFQVDIHPNANIGVGVMLDHGTGIVIGETSSIGHGCTLLHNVTLGGTGKDNHQRHPQVGNYCLIGAGCSLLGNIAIGNGCKIGAGSIVLSDIDDGATALGSPAKVIGWAKEKKPGSCVDASLCNVVWKNKSSNGMNNGINMDMGKRSYFTISDHMRLNEKRIYSRRILYLDIKLRRRISRLVGLLVSK